MNSPKIINNMKQSPEKKKKLKILQKKSIASKKSTDMNKRVVLERRNISLRDTAPSKLLIGEKLSVENWLENGSQEFPVW